MGVAALDDGADSCPSIDVYFAGLSLERRVGAEVGTQREVTDRQSDTVAVRCGAEPVQAVVAEGRGPVGFPFVTGGREAVGFERARES